MTRRIIFILLVLPLTAFPVVTNCTVSTLCSISETNLLAWHTALYDQTTKMMNDVESRWQENTMPLGNWSSFGGGKVVFDYYAPTFEHVVIKQGDTRIDFPFDSANGRGGTLFVSNQFKGLKPVAGDMILWQKEGREVRWVRTKDGNWLGVDGVPHPAFVIPIECRPIIYRRTINQSDTVAIPGYLDTRKKR